MGYYYSFKYVFQICECQQQFARCEDGERVPLPCFAGRLGSEVTQRLLYIEATFDKSLQVLRSVQDILDVRNPSWHEDYSRCGVFVNWSGHREKERLCEIAGFGCFKSYSRPIWLTSCLHSEWPKSHLLEAAYYLWIFTNHRPMSCEFNVRLH